MKSSCCGSPLTSELAPDKQEVFKIRPENGYKGNWIQLDNGNEVKTVKYEPDYKFCGE